MELIDTLKEAQHEIRDLRRRNEILSAKVEVMDAFMQVLHTEPARRTQGMAPDVVFEMEKAIAKLEDEEKPQMAKSPVDMKGTGRFG